MRRAWFKPALGVLGLLAVFGLVGGGWWFTAERKYQRDLQRIRASGFATSLEELASKEGGSNALELYQKGGTEFNALVAAEPSARYDRFSYVGNSDWSGSADPGFAARFKAKFGEITTSLLPAAHMPATWSPRYRENFSGKTVLRLQAGLAISEIKDGDFGKALSAFELLSKMTSDFMATPYVLQYSTAEYGAWQELEVLKILLPAISHDRASLERLNQILNDLPPMPSFESPMRGQIAQVLELTSSQELLQKYMEEEIAKRVENDSMISTAIGVRMLSREVAAEIADLLEKAPKDDWRSYDKYWTDATSIYDAKMNESALNFILCQELRFRTGSYYAKALTYRRLSKLAARIMLDRARGKYPPEMSSFGELAQDPFGVDQFMYAFGPRSLLIYSVNSNGKDDGGASNTLSSRDGISTKPALDITLQISLWPNDLRVMRH